MMSDDGKKKSSLIIATMKAGKPSSEEAELSEDGAEVDDSMPKEAAAEELMAAIESKSPAAIVEAFQSMMELCKYSEE